LSAAIARAVRKIPRDDLKVVWTNPVTQRATLMLFGDTTQYEGLSAVAPTAYRRRGLLTRCIFV